MARPYAYYNENDPFAAATLKCLISRGEIMQGDVDERSIEDVTPADLEGYTQHHFFAGIGVWSYALRRAGWPDDRPVATGSCPCQPFSAAGKGLGFADERHLWPAFYHLITQCGFERVYGEQVASADGLAWLDIVHADLEAAYYAVAATDICAAGVGAPHIRQRLYWMADAASPRQQWWWSGETRNGRDAARVEPQRLRNAGGLADTLRDRTEYESGQSMGAQAALDGRDGRVPGQRLRSRIEGTPVGVANSDCDESRTRRDGGSESGKGLRFEPGRRSAADRLADNVSQGLEGRDARSMGRQRPAAQRGGGEPAHQPATGPVNGLWSAADWLYCRDGKWRPVEPGTFPLAHGAPARVGRLRGYGNAINAEQAATFIAATMDVDAGLDLI